MGVGALPNADGRAADAENAGDSDGLAAGRASCGVGASGSARGAVTVAAMLVGRARISSTLSISAWLSNGLVRWPSTPALRPLPSS